jgi:glc operon protein GlcG
MLKLTAAILILMTTTLAPAADLPTRRVLNVAAIKTMVAAAEAEAQKRNVHVTICIVDDSLNLLFLQKGDGAALNTIQFCQKKAHHSAYYSSPSKGGQDAVKSGDIAAMAFPEYFPNQGGLPIIVDGQTLGAIAVSGAPSPVDEAIAQTGIDALLKR